MMLLRIEEPNEGGLDVYVNADANIVALAAAVVRIAIAKGATLQEIATFDVDVHQVGVN